MAAGDNEVSRFSEMADVVVMRHQLEPEPGLVFVSPSSLPILGYEPEEFYESATLGHEIVHPSDRARLKRECERDPEAIFVGRAIRKDGSVRWIERRQTRVDEPGQPPYLEATLRDITDQREMMEALRESQLRFRTAFEQAPIGIALVATDGTWLEVNQALCDFLGYSEEELRHTTWQALTHPSDVGADLRSAEAMLEGRSDGYTMEKRYVRKDGEVVAGRLTVGLVRAPDGEPLYFVSQIEDITGKRAAQPPQAPSADLTSRQVEILQLLADGKSTGEIAEHLHLSVATVRNHVAHLLANLGVHTRVQAIVAATRRGLIRVPNGESAPDA